MSAAARTRPRCAYCAHPLAPVEIAFEDGDTVCADVARCGKKRRPMVAETVIPTPSARVVAVGSPAPRAAASVAPSPVPRPASPAARAASRPASPDALTLTDAATLAEADAIALLRAVRAFKHGGHRGVAGPDEAFDRARVSWHAYRRAALRGGQYDRAAAVDRWRGAR